MPADPFRQLGISRRPSNVIFGTAPVTQQSAPTWSRATIQDAADESLALEEAQAAANERRKLAREQEAELAADEFIRAEPSAREKFLGENPAIVGSKRFNEIAQYQQMQPSYADTRLANSVALRIEDPEARRVFSDAVAAGKGTLAARDMADTFIAKRRAAGELGKVGYSPDEAEALVAQRHDPAHVNYHIAQKKGETLFHKDPQAQALEKYYHVLKDRAAAEKASSIMEEISPETMLEMKQVTDALGGLYKAKSPLASPDPLAPSVVAPSAVAPSAVAPSAVVPSAVTTSAEAKASLLKKLGLVKP